MKGLGSIVIAMLFLSIFLLSVVPLIMHMYTTSMNRTPVYEDPMYRVLQISMKTLSRDIVAFFNASSLELQIVNRGGVDLEIDRGILYTVCGSNEMYIDTKARVPIPSGRIASIQIGIDQNICRNPRPRVLHIITRDGVVLSSTVITIEEIQEIIRGNRTSETTTVAAISSAITAIPIRIHHEDNITSIVLLTRKGFEIHTLDNMDRPTRLQPYTNLGRGMSGGTITTRYIWSLHRVYNSASISISNQVVRNLWIGYDPRDPAKYNIIITADSLTINVGGQSLSLSSYTRVKIYGFKPSTTQGILQLNETRVELIWGRPPSITRRSFWVTQPNQDIANYTFRTITFETTFRRIEITTSLTMSGIADRIEVYVRNQDTESGYNPYIMFMNTDRSRGLSSILFTTIDRTRGFHDSRNEGVDSLLDYSTTPLVLVYREYSISNINSSAVVIAINYRFHDNEGSDAEGTSVDRPIMFVGLVDSNGVVYSYRSYTFRELTRYEDTYPPIAQAQSSLVFIPLPPRDIGEKVFYVFIAIQDPYSYSGNLDDLDFTLYIESLSIIPLS